MIDLRKFEGSALAELKQMEDALNAVETHILEQAKRWYAGVLDFRVRKDNRDENNKRAREDLTGTVAENIDVFTEACIKPFKVKLEAFEMSIAADKNEIQELVNRSIEVSKPLSAANRIEREPSPVGGDEREERAATAPSGKR